MQKRKADIRKWNPFAWKQRAWGRPACVSPVYLLYLPRTPPVSPVSPFLNYIKEICISCISQKSQRISRVSPVSPGMRRSVHFRNFRPASKFMSGGARFPTGSRWAYTQDWLVTVCHCHAHHVFNHDHVYMFSSGKASSCPLIIKCWKCVARQGPQGIDISHFPNFKNFVSWYGKRSVSATTRFENKHSKNKSMFDANAIHTICSSTVTSTRPLCYMNGLLPVRSC